MTSTRKLLLYFPKSETEKPIVYHLIKDFDLVVNIFRAKVTPEEFGYLAVDVSGTEENLARGLDWVRTFNVEVHEASVGVTWDAERCTHCGACLTHCPTQALHIADSATRTVAFAAEKCVECLACLKLCPFGACASLF
jgi:L-aspartate semialdehyde sulfurtransferase ferredoxin